MAAAGPSAVTIHAHDFGIGIAPDDLVCRERRAVFGEAHHMLRALPLHWVIVMRCCGGIATGSGGAVLALREFRDDRGRTWQVCDVNPTYVERRTGVERRRAARPDDPDRRERRQHRMAVAPRFRMGWLIFETAAERRRLGPIPPGWDLFPDTELCTLLRAAEPLRPVT